MTKKYIERTKDFYVLEGKEKEESYIKAIKRREMLGDRIKVARIINK